MPCIEITGFKSLNSVGKGTEVIKAFDEPNNIPVSTVYGYDFVVNDSSIWEWTNGDSV